VEILVPHKVLRCVVGPGTGTNALLHVNVAGLETKTTYAHATPIILEVTPVSTRGGHIDVVGKHFGVNAKQVSVHIGGVRCEEVVMIKPHTKIRCVAPRMRASGSLVGASDDPAALVSATSSATTSSVTRAPHLTPPPHVPTKRRQRSNSGDERRDLIIIVDGLTTTTEMIYVNEVQHDALASSRGIEERQRRQRRRPASTPPREYGRRR
jgi:hypothetical protein